MKALIDMDIVVYMAGFSSQRTIWQANMPCQDDVQARIIFSYNTSKTTAIEILKSQGIEKNDVEWTSDVVVEPLEFALASVKRIINRILEGTKCQEYVGYMSTSNDTTLFRNKIAVTKPYKGNRLDFKKPEHYHSIREYILKHWNTNLVVGIEADDALGIHQNSSTIICSIDKDLLQIPGMHYNIKTGEIITVSEFEGHYNFYKQVLTGDTADNIPGLYGIGEAKAKDILENCKTVYDLYNQCCRAYSDLSRKDDFEEYLHEQCNLLYILRRYDKRWSPPN